MELARRHLVQARKIAPSDPVSIIDLDAHRGNGNEDIFFDSPKSIFSICIMPKSIPDRSTIPPGFPTSIPFARTWMSIALYLSKLKVALASFIGETPRPAIVFYNAGTDIVMDVALGLMSISDNGVFERDCHVVQTLRALGLPTAMLTSGGYTDTTRQRIARTAAWAMAGGPS